MSNPKLSKAYACSSCSAVFSVANKGLAEACCRCRECGVLLSNTVLEICRACVSTGKLFVARAKLEVAQQEIERLESVVLHGLALDKGTPTDDRDCVREVLDEPKVEEVAFRYEYPIPKEYRSMKVGKGRDDG